MRTLAIIAIIVVVFMGFLVVNAEWEGRIATSQLLPGIQPFLAAHPEYGAPRTVEAMPDWAEGRRQRVRTTVDNYLFYMAGETVVGIWRYEPRVQVYQADIPRVPTATQ